MSITNLRISMEFLWSKKKFGIISDSVQAYATSLLKMPLSKIL